MMETTTALGVLILSAQLAGVDTIPITPAAKAAPVGAAGGEPRAILKLSLQEITQNQERAYSLYPVGRGYIAFSVGLDPAGHWVKFRQDGRSAAHALAELEQGVEESFPVEPYRFLYENRLIRAIPVWEPQEPQANVMPADLIQGLYSAALRVLFTPLEYAVVYEDGSLAPASVSLIREDIRGRRWLIHHKAAELKEIRWFVTLDGKAYGMRLEGEDLVFYSKAPALEIEPERPL